MTRLNKSTSKVDSSYLIVIISELPQKKSLTLSKKHPSSSSTIESMSTTHLGSGRWTFFIAIIQGCVSTRVANGINHQHLNTSRFGDRDFQKPLGKLTLDTANTQQLPLFIRRLTWNPKIGILFSFSQGWCSVHHFDMRASIFKTNILWV